MSELFITWLRKQKHRNDAIGDLSIDFIADKNNDLITGYKSFCFYLDYHGACDNARGALERAYKEYQYQKKPVRYINMGG